VAQEKGVLQQAEVGGLQIPTIGELPETPVETTVCSTFTILKFLDQEVQARIVFDQPKDDCGESAYL
jgi:hypothetical protein